MDGRAGIMRVVSMLLVLYSLSGCGCALDSGEARDSSYFKGCWEHLRQNKEAKEGKY